VKVDKLTRMLTKEDRKNQYKALEATFRRRAENLRKCRDAAGSWSELARWTGETEPMLVQVGSDNAVRTIGEKFARKIEQRLGLAPGWLDNKH
jgi:hypothetical protein